MRLIYTIILLLVFELLSFSQSDTIFRKGINFVGDGSVYGISEAVLNPNKRGVFPFNIKYSLIDTCGKFISNIPIEKNQNLIYILNDTIFIYSIYDNNNSFIYKKNLISNEEVLLFKCPFKISGFTPYYTDDVSSTMILYLKNERDYIHFFDFKNETYLKMNINYIGGKVKNKKIGSIAIQGKKYLLINYYERKPKEFGLIVADLEKKQIIHDKKFNSGSYRNTISAIYQNKIYTLSSFVEDSSLLYISNLPDCNVIYSMKLSPNINPEKINLYRYDDDRIKLLITYEPVNMQYYIEGDHYSLEAKLEYSSFDIVVLDIPVVNSVSATDTIR